jgi:hypothetical protein
MISHLSSRSRYLLLCAGAVISTSLAAFTSSAAQNIPAPHTTAIANYGKLPLRFEENRGQAAPAIGFLTHGSGYGLYFTQQAAVLALRGRDGIEQPDIIRIQFDKSRGVPPRGRTPLPGIVNYLQGSNPGNWKTGIPTYAEVRYASIYPGVDLIYYGNEQQLEYDFRVAPHAQTAEIRLQFKGAQHLALDALGNLVIQAQHGSVAFHKPVLYQTERGRRREIPGSFTLLAHDTVGFHVGAYDHTRTLVIDPTLLYSTYIGGTYQDSVTAMAVDASGNAYITGSTTTGSNTTADFPVTAGAYNTTGDSGYYAAVAFVSKLNASGTALLYSTYLGPAAKTSAIAIDAAGDAYITGTTTSASYPTTASAYQKTSKATSGNATGFLTKLNATGTALVFSTFLGGSSSDSPGAIALNSAGDIYLAGSAFSSNFPTTTGAYQTTNKAAPYYGWNNFVTEFNPTASALIFSTLLGGGDEYSSPPQVQLALDSTGNTYIASYALATDFPVTTGAYQTKSLATSGNTNMTLSKLNPSGTTLLYSTWFDGPGATYRADVAKGIAVDASGNLYVAGSTYESAFPTTSGALQKTNKNGGGSLPTGFITKLNPTGTALVYSTYLGGSATSQGDSIDCLTIDASGDVYVGGNTGSTDFPVTSNAYQKTNLAAGNNGGVPFLTEINPTGSSVIYSTYFGSVDSYSDAANAIALGPNSSVYIAGTASSTYHVGTSGANNFPITTGAFQATSNTQYGYTGFVAAFNLGTAPTTIPTSTVLASSANPAQTGLTTTFTATVIASTGTAIPSGNVVFSVDGATAATVALNTKGVATFTPTTLALGTHAILASYAGNATYAASAQGINQAITPLSPTITPAGGVYTSAQLISIADTTPATVVYYTLDGSAPTSSSTKYSAPILVSSSQQVSAIAIASGVPASTITRATYSFLSAPYALAAPANAIATTSATLNAVLSTGGMAGSYSFVYGTSTTALTSTTPATSFGGSVLNKLSVAPFQASAKLTTLITKTTYYFKVIVTTAAGTSSGQILSFTTN